jgi:hypothetical protein
MHADNYKNFEKCLRRLQIKDRMEKCPVGALTCSAFDIAKLLSAKSNCHGAAVFVFLSANRAVLTPEAAGIKKSPPGAVAFLLADIAPPPFFCPNLP